MVSHRELTEAIVEKSNELDELKGLINDHALETLLEYAKIKYNFFPSTVHSIDEWHVYGSEIIANWSEVLSDDSGQIYMPTECLWNEDLLIDLRNKKRKEQEQAQAATAAVNRDRDLKEFERLKKRLFPTE